jgi:hypothetical protein
MIQGQGMIYFDGGQSKVGEFYQMLEKSDVTGG